MRVTQVLVVRQERREELAAGDHPESDLPVQRVNYSEAEDLKIQLAEANKQTNTWLSHCWLLLVVKQLLTWQSDTLGICIIWRLLLTDYLSELIESQYQWKVRTITSSYRALAVCYVLCQKGYVFSFNLHTIPRQVFSWSPFYRQGDWGPEKFLNLPKIILLVSGRARL